ncbi:MAG: DUF3142 domain-containing protein [Alphaproteobacteria bacterium]|nr:DUF3142 domain-containing protein [Alphaproteobacteria bacterium]
MVDANRYQSFFLWAGVRPQTVLKNANEIYLLAGEVSARGRTHIVSQRSDVPHVRAGAVWIVYRVETLDWDDAIYAQILIRVERWRQAGNKIAGLQIDFDAGTRHLNTYAKFLKGLRTRLPSGTKLSITGLLDWSANGDPQALSKLEGVVDEVVLQIYQGRRVIPGYADYLKRLGSLNVPFRIGLLQGGEWHAPPRLEENPAFRGYVVFLQNTR